MAGLCVGGSPVEWWVCVWKAVLWNGGSVCEKLSCGMVCLCVGRLSCEMVCFCVGGCPEDDALRPSLEEEEMG